MLLSKVALAFDRGVPVSRLEFTQKQTKKCHYYTLIIWHVAINQREKAALKKIKVL